MQRFYNNPLDKLKTLQLSNLASVYMARKSTQRADWNRYSDLLIDKFAIHASTLYHLFYGIIEHENTPTHRKVGYDLFSINSLLRVLIETYATFNHLFVYPKDSHEKEFRVLLWQLDGLLDKRKFRIEKGKIESVDSDIENNENLIVTLLSQLKDSQFIKTLEDHQANKIVNFEKQRTNWRFLHKEGKILPLKIIELVQFTCPLAAYFNVYKYASMHTHPGYISVEHFEKIRGKIISNEYADSLIRIAIFTVMFAIYDITLIDKNAANEFLRFSKEDKEDFNGVIKELKEHPALNIFSEWR